MKKESIAEKMAQKAFNSADFQKSWNVHMQAFGPILEPAFAEDYQSRVHLTAALNHISRRELAQGMAKLKGLRDKCVTDADKAALLFFYGVHCEMAGNQEQMLTCYDAANGYGHRFYLPYLKAAKFYHNVHDYEKAEVNYRGAIDCFTTTGLDQRDRLILGSAHANLATTLTMMHRYDEAEATLETSRSLYPNAPGRAVVEALLFAVRGDAHRAEASLEALKAQVPMAYSQVKESVEKILAGTNPLFCAVPVDGEKIADFWRWFAEYGPALLEKLEQEQYEAALDPVAKRLVETFPFLEEPPIIALGKNENGYVLQLRDLYAVGVGNAFEMLLKNCPGEIGEQWQFAVVH